MGGGGVGLGKEGKEWSYGMALNVFVYFNLGILLSSVKLARLSKIFLEALILNKCLY
jgi:hypothetical protein